MILLEVIGTAIFSSLLIAVSVIIFPDFVYSHIKNKKVEKFLNYDLVKAYWILLTLVIDAAIIIKFVNLICCI